jgi:hypothetical protein
VTSNGQIFHEFEDAHICDLEVDHVYKGNSELGFGGDVLTKLVRSLDLKNAVGNQGGFRYSGAAPSPRLVVLTSNWQEIQWPDEFDRSAQRLTYFGDNRGGASLLETPRRGNSILKQTYDKLGEVGSSRISLPVFLHFQKFGEGRDWKFTGHFVPGAVENGVRTFLEEVVDPEGRRNYKATFTRLPVALVKRSWLDDVLMGRDIFENASDDFKNWLLEGYPQIRAN